MNTNRNILASALAASMALALAACGAGGGGAGKALPASPARTSSLKTAMSKIAFSFSKSGATTASKAIAKATASSRSPQYLPSTIASVAVGVTLVNGAAPSSAIAPIVAAVGPTAPGCGTDPNNSGNYLCTLTFALPIGSDTLQVSAYDGANGTGNLVSQQLPVVTVVLAQANQFAMTLDAVPGTIAFGTLPGGVNCGGTPVSCAISAGQPAFNVPITVSDAHGTPMTSNAVSGSPTLSVSSDNTAAVTVSVTQNPYAVVITPAASGTGTAHVTLTATPANAGDGLSATQMSAAVSLNPAPQALSGPIGMALDRQGNLWVTSIGSGQVTEYAPPYTGSPVFAVDGLFTPVGVLFDSAGDLLVSEFGNNDVRVYAPPYADTPTATIATGLQPFQMALDASGSLYVGITGGIGVQVFNPPFTSSSTLAYTIANGMGGGFGLAFDGSGNLWYHDRTAGIIEYSPPFSAASAPVTIMNNGSFQNLGDMAFDASGNLYLTNLGGNVQEVSPPFAPASTAFQTLAVPGNAYGIAATANDVFVSNLNGGVSQYALPITGASTPITTTLAGKRSAFPQAFTARFGAAR
jgi:hypothetical protein